jgi:hypothetical protein
MISREGMENRADAHPGCAIQVSFRVSSWGWQQQPGFLGLVALQPSHQSKEVLVKSPEFF